MSNFPHLGISLYRYSCSGIVKLLDEVCVSHTKQIGDNETVCTTQEVRKNAAH